MPSAVSRVLRRGYCEDSGNVYQKVRKGVLINSSKVYQNISKELARLPPESLPETGKVYLSVQKKSGCKSYGKFLVKFTGKLP